MLPDEEEMPDERGRPRRWAFAGIVWRLIPWHRRPRVVARELQAMWQRAVRGWADQDAYSLNQYMMSWLPDAVRAIANNPYGDPELHALADDLEWYGRWYWHPYPSVNTAAFARARDIMWRFADAFPDLWS